MLCDQCGSPAWYTINVPTANVVNAVRCFTHGHAFMDGLFLQDHRVDVVQVVPSRLVFSLVPIPPNTLPCPLCGEVLPPTFKEGVYGVVMPAGDIRWIHKECAPKVYVDAHRRPQPICMVCGLPMRDGHSRADGYGVFGPDGHDFVFPDGGTVPLPITSAEYHAETKRIAARRAERTERAA
jgi:hypothetical protein